MRLSHLNINKVLAPEIPVVSMYTCSCKEMNRLRKFILCTYHLHASPNHGRGVRANLPVQTQANEKGRNQTSSSRLSSSYSLVWVIE